ncbi:translational activator of GCN4, partial [Coemansia sp. RSA 2320]
MSDAVAEGEGEKFSWKAFTQKLSDGITVTSINSRRELLSGELLSNIGAHPLSDRELVDLVVVLKATASLYVDKPSRSMVLEVLGELSIKKADVFVKAIASVLDPVVESAQPRSIVHPDFIPTTVALRFVLLSWINLALAVPINLLGVPPESLVADAAWKRLVLLASRLLWGIAPAHPGQRCTKAASLSSSAHHGVWRTLRGCPGLVGPMLTVLTSETSGTDAGVLIGNIVSTALRVQSKDAQQQVENAKDSIISYIDRVLIGSKTLVSYSCVADMRDFLKTYVGGQFEALFKSSIAKMLLRSPEAVLPTCLWLLEALGNDTVDMSSLYFEVFADPLVSNLFKSSNALVRQSAGELLKFLAEAPRTEEDAAKAADILCKPLTLGRYTQAEHRVAAYQLLGGVRAGPGNGWASSARMLPALVQMSGKESHDAAVSALFVAMGRHIAVIIESLKEADDSSSAAYLSCDAALKQVSEAAVKGLALPERAAMIRQGWAADAIGEALWSAVDGQGTSAWMTEHIYPIVKALTATAEKASVAPLVAGGSGTLDAHVGFALALRMAKDVASIKAAADKLVGLVTGSEKSLVLWDKVYHKCTSVRECVWLLRSAQMLFASGSDDARLAKLMVWVLCRFPERSLAVARAGLQSLKAMGQVDAVRLWRLLEPAVLEEMNGSVVGKEASTSYCTWTSILRAVVPEATAGTTLSASDRAGLLESMALAANHPAVVVGEMNSSSSIKGSFWIALAQWAGVDPGELCFSRLASLKQTIRRTMVLADESAGGHSTAMGEAAMSVAKDLVFIGGDSVALQLLEFAQEDIDPVQLGSISGQDIEVWQTLAGQLHFDPVLAKEQERERGQGKSKKRDVSDSEWAEQLQRDIAARKGLARKLSKEEQDMLDKQWAKENEIRARVERAHGGLRRGLAVVRAVVDGSTSVASSCMAVLVRIVVERAMLGGKATSERLAGAEIYAALLAMSRAASGLEEAQRTAVVVGLLRARGFERVVAADWKQESLEDLATRLYFRLRVGCEGTALEAAGFNFLLPFMRATADAGGWGHKVKRKGVVEEHDEYAQMDHAAEQLTMVVDLLSFHAHFGRGEAVVPRKEMISLLILIMSTQPMLLAACRQSLVRLAEEMEGTDTAAERDALLDGAVGGDSAVRSACLAALDYVDLTEMDYSGRVWINMGGLGSGDVALEENARMARALWADNGMEVQAGLVADAIPFLHDAAAEIRRCAARAIGLAVQEAGDEAVTDGALQGLQDAYGAWHVSLEPEYDQFGLVVPGTQHRVDVAYAREAVGQALEHVAAHLATSAQVCGLVRFLVERRVLGERDAGVRAQMLAAGAAAVAQHGSRWTGALVAILEGFLAGRDEGTAAHDSVREGVVVLLGRLAQHLGDSADDARRVGAAVAQLVAALATPAEAVQSAASECLPALARRISDDQFEAVVGEVMGAMLGGESYSQRRGGAYGLAGLVKGRGLAALKRLAVVDRLREACGDRAAFQRRQGALFGFERLAAALGRLFEPYAIQFVPLLLGLFGDGNAAVREAALDTARVVMGNISGHGVKLVLPAALAGLSSDQWRTKKGSVEMLGAMAFCAPKQLSVSLPAVVPRIVDVLTDAHGQVADAARAALLRFGSVIHNPEIQAVVPELLAALDDPAARTDAALGTLLHTAFVHYIDAPSLALVVPIVQRGLAARAASTKRKAAQIMGSMATLTDPADLAPYLGTLEPLLRGVLVDPVPEARATAAKALGSLVQRLGEARFPSLVGDLVRVLKSDASGVDRAGAAQGLSEVLAGVGLERLEGLLPEVLANCASARAAVREGFMMLLIFLPTTFAAAFQRFLPRVLPRVLLGLADDHEHVRSAALRAGRILVIS